MSRSRGTAGWHVAFDLDDTLIVTQAKFDAATARVSSIVASSCGITPEEAHDAFSRADRDAVTRQRGFRVARYSDSWVRAARRLAAASGRELPDDVARAVTEITMGVWCGPYDVYAGAAAAVASTAAIPGVSCVSILTLGDEAIQREKLGCLPARLLDAVDWVSVVGRKDADAFASEIGRRPASRCVMVGNSMRSDVQPALACGMWAVHVDQHSWDMDGIHSADEGSPMFRRVRSVSRVPGAVRDIVGA